MGYDGLHFLIDGVALDKLVGHGDPERFHGVVVGVVIGADHLVEVVDNILFEVEHSFISNLIIVGVYILYIV